MADTVEVKLEGLGSLLGKLEAVKHETRRKGGRSALRKAAQLIAQRAREGAQRVDDSATGRSIADNIVLRWNGRLWKHSGNLGFRVGVLHGALLPKKGESVDTSGKAPTPHWRLLEFGTRKMAAQPFMRPALADNTDAATAVFVSEYQKALDRAIRRAAKKGTTP